MRVAHWLVLALVLGGCAKLSRSRPEVPNYPDGPDGLRALFGDVLEAARKDDRERAHDIFATTIMSDAELEQLFGPRAQALAPRYHQLMGSMVNRGAVELVGQIYEHKYDTIDVEPDEHDVLVKAALKVPVTLYSVRVRSKDDTRGLRYDFFFYWNGHWRTGNQLGKFLGQN
jgi:hypothetical protein